MLTQVYIKNFAIVDALHLHLERGFNALTGETGAGKSILLGAIQLALGERADQQTVRPGSDKCTITLAFDLRSIPEAQQWLLENNFESEAAECMITRIIHADGKSRLTINGQPCPLTLMRNFASLVINIYSQHQHQALLKPHYQQSMLDIYAGHEARVKALEGLYHEWRKLSDEIEVLTQQAASRESELELLHYQANELQQLNLQTGEWEELHEKHKRLQNAKSLGNALQETIDALDGDEQGLRHHLERARQRLQHMSTLDKSLENTAQLIETASIHVDEALANLTDYQQQWNLNPETLAEVEERLSTIHDLARKHRVAPETLPHLSEQLEQQIALIEEVEENLFRKQQQQQTVEKEYRQAAKIISKRRQEVAVKLAESVTHYMQQLGMKGGKFIVRLEAMEDKLTAFGLERVHFEVCTNPGSALLPLARVVSGGELSRIGLALQVITTEVEDTPTLIFDEVDTGIGGETANTVGALLQSLGQKAQVFCITHLAQVAAKADYHFKVAKYSDQTSTRTAIEPLTRSMRSEEVARMLAGEVTPQSLAHAQEMLTKAAQKSPS